MLVDSDDLGSEYSMLDLRFRAFLRNSPPLRFLANVPMLAGTTLVQLYSLV